MSLTDHSATELSQGLAQQQFSSRELVTHCLECIERHDTTIGAFLSVDRAGALRSAEDADRRRAAGQPLSPLDGLPVALKDVLCTQDARTTCGSRMLAEFIPPYDATVVTRLREAGAVLIGKTNMDEFAMGGSTENSALGKTLQSVGCAVGSRVGPVGDRPRPSQLAWFPSAIGTDTGGSIRQPAAYCGMVGLKPTYGRVSRYGLVAFASSLDQVGPMTRTAQDAALLLETIAGHDPRDSTSAPLAVPPYGKEIESDLGRLTLGVVREHFGTGLDARWPRR